MDEIYKIIVTAIVTAAISGPAGQYWGIRKNKKETTLGVKRDFYTKVQQSLDRVGKNLSVNDDRGGIYGMNDYDSIFERISEIRAIVAEARSYLKPDTIKCAENLIRSLDEGMTHYPEHFDDVGPSDVIQQMKNSTAKAKENLTELGRKELAA